MSKIETGHSSLVVAYKAHKKVVGDTCTHHMVLFYAVECGLKAVVCSSLYGGRPKTISDIVLSNGASATTHRLNELVRHLKLPASIGRCPDVKVASRGDLISIQHGDIHQAWRYGVKIDATTEAAAIAWLKKMLSVIDSKI